MQVTITGASGLVGGNLAVTLLADGHRVRATKRARSRTDHLRGHDIEWVEADLGDPDALARAFEGSEAVFHCAALVSVQRRPTPELIATNVDGTRHVLDAVRRARAGRLVHCSTVSAVGLSEDGLPCTEAARFNFAEHGLDDGYCVTKREAEDRVRAAVGDGLDAVIVNPTYMFGPLDVKPSSGRMIVDVVRRRVPGWSTGWNNFVDVRDVARGMVLAFERGERGQRYILGGENLPYREIFERIARVAGVRPPRFRVPRMLARAGGVFGDLQEKLTGREPLISSITVRYGFCDSFIFSSERAERELGYRHGPIEGAIRDAIVWFRAHGQLPRG